jgi:hypothetical protein
MRDISITTEREDDRIPTEREGVESDMSSSTIGGLDETWGKADSGKNSLHGPGAAWLDSG